MTTGATRHLIIGLGEIGRPILEFVQTMHHKDQGIEIMGRDLDPFEPEGVIHTIHICIPFGEFFADAVLAYLEQYKPDLCIIHSTVQPGTTRAIAEQSPGSLVAYSPVRGRHGEMVSDLLRYRKFVAAPNCTGLMVAVGTLIACGFEVESMEPPEALELAKLLETSYSGLLIAWSQEMARYAEAVGCSYWDVIPFLAEPPHLPGVAFQPGHIGGHCIMPNLELLEMVRDSDFITAIQRSNCRIQPVDGMRLRPIPMSEFERDEQQRDMDHMDSLDCSLEVEVREGCKCNACECS